MYGWWTNGRRTEVSVPVALGIGGSQVIKDQHPILRTLRPFKASPYSPVTKLRVGTFVTGGCIGVDALVGRWLANHCPWAHHVVVVPAQRDKVEYWWLDFPNRDIEIVEMAPGTSYMDRNDELIRRSEEWLSFPSRPRYKRSGTWATVRRAEKAFIPLRIVMQ